MNNVNINRLGKLIKDYRIYYPMTQAELSEKTGISPRTITRFESGEDISLSNFLKILDALGLTDNISLLIPDQSIRPSAFLNDAPKRKRASSKRDKKQDFKWGDEE